MIFFAKAVHFALNFQLSSTVGVTTKIVRVFSVCVLLLILLRNVWFLRNMQKNYRVVSVRTIVHVEHGHCDNYERGKVRISRITTFQCLYSK